MTDVAGFVAAALLLLVTPGPTNTLLAAGGAARGLRGAIALVGAELLGYALAITLIEIVVVPLASASGVVTVALRLGCALYLGLVAVQVWRSAHDPSGAAISFRRVFLATLSNPKALVFAFVILPPPSISVAALMVPYGLMLGSLIALAGSTWVLAGSTLHGRLGPKSGVAFRRASSVVVAAFAALVLLSALNAGAGFGRPKVAATTFAPIERALNG